LHAKRWYDEPELGCLGNQDDASALPQQRIAQQALDENLSQRCTLIAVPMSRSHETPYPRTSTSSVELVPYSKELPMTTPQPDDFPSRSTGLASDADQPPHVRFRSSVPLLPTPGTVTKRHPGYVRFRSMLCECPSSFHRSPCHSASGS
jgi:hypothetical protein